MTETNSGVVRRTISLDKEVNNLLEAEADRTGLPISRIVKSALLNQLLLKEKSELGQLLYCLKAVEEATPYFEQLNDAFRGLSEMNESGSLTISDFRKKILIDQFWGYLATDSLVGDVKRNLVSAIDSVKRSSGIDE